MSAATPSEILVEFVLRFASEFGIERATARGESPTVDKDDLPKLIRATYGSLSRVEGLRTSSKQGEAAALAKLRKIAPEAFGRRNSLAMTLIESAAREAIAISELVAEVSEKLATVKKAADIDVGWVNDLLMQSNLNSAESIDESPEALGRRGALHFLASSLEQLRDFPPSDSQTDAARFKRALRELAVKCSQARNRPSIASQNPLTLEDERFRSIFKPEVKARELRDRALAVLSRRQVTAQCDELSRMLGDAWSVAATATWDQVCQQTEMALLHPVPSYSVGLTYGVNNGRQLEGKVQAELVAIHQTRGVELNLSTGRANQWST